MAEWLNCFQTWFDKHIKGRAGVSKRGYDTSFEAYGECRDKIDCFDREEFRVVNYSLWDTVVFSATYKNNRLVSAYFGSWDSNLTRDRLEYIKRYFHLPFSFIMREGELYCMYGEKEWVRKTEARFDNICVDFEQGVYCVEVLGAEKGWLDLWKFDVNECKHLNLED